VALPELLVELGVEEGPLDRVLNHFDGLLLAADLVPGDLGDLLEVVAADLAPPEVLQGHPERGLQAHLVAGLEGHVLEV